MGRPALSMAALALVAIALSMLIPVIGQFIIAPLAAFLIGGGAGWWASKALGMGTAGRGAGAGALAGIGALLGAAIGLALLGGITGSRASNGPAFQQSLEDLERQLEEAQQADPNAEGQVDINPGDLQGAGGVLGGLGGGLVGFCFGLGYLLLSTIGGLIGGLIYGRRGMPATAGYPGGYVGGAYQPPQMGSPGAMNSPGTGLPQMGSTPTTGYGQPSAPSGDYGQSASTGYGQSASGDYGQSASPGYGQPPAADEPDRGARIYPEDSDRGRGTRL